MQSKKSCFIAVLITLIVIITLQLVDAVNERSRSSILLRERVNHLLIAISNSSISEDKNNTKLLKMLAAIEITTHAELLNSRLNYDRLNLLAAYDRALKVLGAQLPEQNQEQLVLMKQSLPPEIFIQLCAEDNNLREKYSNIFQDFQKSRKANNSE